MFEKSDRAGRYDSLFSKDMDKIIAERYPTESTEKLAEEFGVTVKQLSTRANALGIYKKTRAGTVRFWTEERDAMLREKYPRTLSIDIANELGISKSAVTSHASELGIKKDTEWMKKQRRKNFGELE